MDLGLKGKKVILSGGSRGLGRAALEIFADEGADVAFFSRDAGQVAEAKASLETRGGKVIADSLDMAGGGYLDWLKKAADELGGVDIFIHNVSSSGAGGTGDWDMTFQYDVKGAVDGCATLQPYLEASEAGSVILMSSTAAVETFIQPAAFNALKAALVTYGKQLSQAWGPKGIRVNMVSPGPIFFPGGNWSKIQAGMPDFYKGTEAQMAMGRFGTAEEVAKTVVFLASPASSYTTGTNVIIDGGYTKRVQF
ncbi:SDR family NAD(P)-dependent oxidoreductase [Sphingomonas radiodurans]|uniref:SDR family NAD(P)-dependent oxidoreductase n=1 Tax=Sphingomonas radiodurans TaxID=2890321 RepID=UPI001E545FAD|nr:SDR family oxidoreductase [Sphingomonas radiodurans]WBH17786.1 SDR family oxidoreductase [Sphingomonas radiodurans]